MLKTDGRAAVLISEKKPPSRNKSRRTMAEIHLNNLQQIISVSMCFLLKQFLEIVLIKTVRVLAKKRSRNAA